MKIHASINRMVNKEDSAIKAYASVTMDGMFAVHGLRVIETEKGRFVNMPSTSYTNKDGNKQYSDTFHAITKSARTAVNQAVLNAYDLKLQQVQQTDIPQSKCCFFCSSCHTISETPLLSRSTSTVTAFPCLS